WAATGGVGRGDRGQRVAATGASSCDGGTCAGAAFGPAGLRRVPRTKPGNARCRPAAARRHGTVRERPLAVRTERLRPRAHGAGGPVRLLAQLADELVPRCQPRRSACVIRLFGQLADELVFRSLPTAPERVRHPSTRFACG